MNVNKNSDPSKANMLVATFNNGVPIKDHKINVTEDVLLAGSYDDQTKTALFCQKEIMKLIIIQLNFYL